MKKSSIITKIVLAMLVVALIFALVACGKTDKKDTKKKDDTPAEKTAIEKIAEIVLYADPILTTVKGIKADSTVSADLGVTVSYQTTDDSNKTDSGSYSLAVKGNIDKTSPEASISYRTDKQEWLNLTYVGKKFYLNQPLTAVNTEGWENETAKTYATDKVSFDVAAFEPALLSAMDVLMDVIADAVGGINFELSSVGTTLQELPLDLNSLITVTDIEGGYQATTTAEAYDIIYGLIADKEIAFGITGGELLDSILGTGTPSLVIKAKIKDNVVNQISIGYVNGKTSGDITIDLSVSTANKVTVSAPSGYTAKALKASAAAYVGHSKDLSVALDAFANANFSDDYLAYAKATIKKSASEYTLQGVANEDTLKFNMGGIYSALGVSNGMASANYKARVHDNTLTDDKAFDTSIIKMATKEAAKWKTEYYANKGKTHGTDQNPVGTLTNPKKSILVNVYEFLDGDLTALGTDPTAAKYKETDKGKVKYNDPNEQQMMTALKSFKIGKLTIGDYVNFDIDVSAAKTVDKKSVYSNYLNTVKNLIELFAANDQWIIGYDLIKVNAQGKLDGINEFKDLGTFKNWIVLVQKDGKDVVNDAAIQAAGKTNGKYQYGIFNWDTENYNGGVILSGSGDTKGLLDAVNVFAKWDYNNDGTADTFTSDNISECINFNLAKAGIWFADEVVFSAAQKEAIEEKRADYKAKSEAYDNAKKAYNDAKKAYNDNMTADTYAAMNAAKTAMDNAKKARDDAHDAYDTDFETYVGKANINTYANKVIKAVLGYSKNDSTNYLKSAIDDGLYLNLGSKKDAGIYGFIELRVSEEENSEVFAKAEVSVGFAANTVVADATKADVTDDVFANAIDLTSYTKDETTGEVTYTYVGETDPRSGILGELLNIWDGYCRYAKV